MKKIKLRDTTKKNKSYKKRETNIVITNCWLKELFEIKEVQKNIIANLESQTIPS